MANTIIQLKHSTVTGNVPASLANGEISINSRDGKLFYSTPLGVVTAFNPYPGPSGLDTELQFNDGGSLGGSEKLTFNKTTGLLTVNGTVRANIFSDDGIDIFNFANNAYNTANAAFVRANNSLDANNGGTVTGTITATAFITTGSFGNITGANTIYANNFVANTGFIQFSDGSKQYTANAGSGGASGTSANGFGVIYTANNNTYANAATANAQLNFVGESGVYVFANSITKTITVAGTPGAQGMTVDYGYVYEPTYYAVDYGTL